MEIQIHTDKHVILDDQLRDRIREDLGGVLSQIKHAVSRIEVHLSDESAGRTSGEHVRCLLEARPTGQETVTVTAHGVSAGASFAGAVDKLESLLRHKLDRLAGRGQRETIRHP